MRLSFRNKLLLIVIMAAFAFVLNTALNWMALQSVSQKLATIEKYFVPKMEIGPSLERQVENLQRRFQNAVAAQDTDILEEARSIRDGFLSQITQADEVLDNDEIVVIVDAFNAYFRTADNVSRRIMSGETGEALSQDILKMQERYARLSEVLKTIVSPDRQELAAAFQSANETQTRAVRSSLFVSVLSLFFVFILSIWVSQGVLRSVRELSAGFLRFGRGEFDDPVLIMSRDEIGQIGIQANRMAENLKRLDAERTRTEWHQAGQTGFSMALQGDLEPHQLADRGLEYLAKYLNATLAALYYFEGGHFWLLSHQGLKIQRDDDRPKFKPGEGLVGRAAESEEISVVENIPEDYWDVASGLGRCKPAYAVFLPLKSLDRVIGVVEFAFLSPCSPEQKRFLSSIRESFAVALEAAQARKTTRDLLEKSQYQAKKLIAQEEELRASNDELQEQQTELQEAYERLDRQRTDLEMEKEKLETITVELEKSRAEVEVKAAEAQLASRYKSEFLANMSHELRTPLNSIMVLSQLLAENGKGNLDEGQVTHARTIHSAGKDLLDLIGDILDLSKVEAGKVEVFPEAVSVQKTAENLYHFFSQQVDSTNIRFTVETDENAPDSIVTDRRRMEQILRNLMSNAVKFTEKGYIKVVFARPGADQNLPSNLPPVITVSIEDSGIGISQDQQELVFESFRQLDSSIARKHRGTGLGLTISRSLARRLGGELFLESVLGKGSKFILVLPELKEKEEKEEKNEKEEILSEPVRPAVVKTSRDNGTADGSVDGIFEGRKILIVDDDIRNIYALREVLLPTGVTIRNAKNGKEALRILNEEDGIELVLMDLIMPEMDGVQATRAIRKQGKFASLPVIVLTAKTMKKDKNECLAAGATDFMVKPLDMDSLVKLLKIWLPQGGEVCLKSKTRNPQSDESKTTGTEI